MLVHVSPHRVYKETNIPHSIVKARWRSAVRSVQLKVFKTIKLASISRIASKLIASSEQRQALLCLRMCVCVFETPVISVIFLRQYGQRETNYIITPTAELGTSAARCCRQVEKRE